MPLKSKRFEISCAKRAMLYCCTVAVLGFAGVMMLGCGSSSYGVEGSVVGPFFSGSVKNSSRPVANALVQLYAAGEGKGIKNQPLLQDKIYTGVDGQFHVSSAYTCPSPMAQVYVLAEGGSSNGDGNGTGNSASTQMAALGNCSDLSGVTNAEVSELTTVASISVLAPFMSTIDTLGAGHANAQALSNAFKVTHELSDTLKKVTSDATLPQAQVESVQKAATLANVLAACDNTSGGSADDGSACGLLFSYTRSNQGAAPLNTAAAMLEISNSPTHNVTQIFSLSTGIRPFRPALDSAPTDWRINLSQTLPQPVFSPAPGSYSGPQTVTLTESAPGTQIYYTIDGAWHQYTGAFTLPFSQTIQAIAIANSISLIATGAYTISAPKAAVFAPTNLIASTSTLSTSSIPIAYGSGFTSSGLRLNGATIVGNALQLTDGGIFEGTTAWFTTPVNIQTFTTDFTFQQTSPNADGFTFTLQNAPAGITTVGANGGDLGYTGIGSSVAVKFDLYNNVGEGVDSTGFYSGGNRPTVPSLDMTSSGVDLHGGHIMHANLAYDGTNLALTLTDTMTGHVFTATSAINIPSLVGGTTAYAGFTAGTGGLSAIQNILTWTYAPGAPAPTFSPEPGNYTAAQSVTISDATTRAAIYYTTDGTMPTISSTQYTAPLNVTASETLKAIAVAPGYSTSSISTGSYLISDVYTPIAYGSGFTSSGLRLNGATIVGNALQLTDGGIFEGTTAWFTTPVNIQTFTTDFTFQQTSPNADGFTFTLQNAPAGITTVGANGGDLGYTGIGSSVAVKFDLYNNVGEGVDSTGFYSGGNRPTVPSLDMTSSGVDLHGGHIMHANLAYDGTNLALTLTDTMTGHVFTATSAINIPSLVGGTTAYAGFTAGTGGLSAIQNILTWTYAPLSLTLTPAMATLVPSQTQQFKSVVTGSTNTAVTWGLSPALGSITSAGLYTAPSTIGSAETVTITATSEADTTRKVSSTISLILPVTVALTPPSVTLTSSQMQQFSPTVTGTPNTAVTWTLSIAVGTISATGLYTAPSSIISAQAVTVIATSVADTTKKASASISLVPPVSVSMTPGIATLSPLQMQQFTSTVTGSSNTSVAWTLSPAVGSISATGLYTAPTSIVSSQTVKVTAISSADPGKSASASITLNPAVSVTLTPGTTTLTPSQTQSFSATVANSSNTAVTWTMSPAVGSISATGLYTAPAMIAAAQTVSVTATSAADSTKKASSSISLVPPVSVALTPGGVSLTPLQTQQFNPAVTGSTNTAVSWMLSPAVGSISATGLYTAPATTASAQTVSVTATSSTDPSKSASATITLNPAVSVSLTPGSVVLTLSQTQMFTASVAHGSNTAVTWSLSPAVGSLSATGLYTAPAAIAGPQNVTVTATSVADPTKAASASITLAPPASTYYVDNIIGNDFNAGTSQNLPFATIAKVNSLTLLPGQTVAFKAGDEWHEMLTIRSSGALNALITYTSYGAGAQPIISAADLTGSPWTLVSGNVWSHAQTVNPWMPNYNGQLMTAVASQAAVVLPNEFYWDGSARIYAYSTVEPSKLIEIPQRASAVISGTASVDGANYIVLNNLELRGAQSYDLECQGGTSGAIICGYWSITGNTFNASYANELFWLFAENVTAPGLFIDHNTFKNGGSFGIALGNGGVMNAQISHNEFFALAQIYNPAFQSNSQGDAIYGFSQDVGEYQSNVEVAYNNCHDIGVNVSQQFGGCYHPDTVTNWNIHNNVAQNTIMPGINIEKGTGTTAKYNLLINTGQHQYIAGLSIRGGEGLGVSDMDVENNTAYGGWWACALGVSQNEGIVSATNILLKKNICVDASSGTELYAGTGSDGLGNTFLENNFGVAATNFLTFTTTQVSTYGAFDAFLGYKTGNLQGDPQFVSSGTGNFTLQATSPAVGIGAFP